MQVAGAFWQKSSEFEPATCPRTEFTPLRPWPGPMSPLTVQTARGCSAWCLRETIAHGDERIISWGSLPRAIERGPLSPRFALATMQALSEDLYEDCGPLQ